jgi:hypothetical protein
VPHDGSHSRLTRLDVLLIATVALVAFAVGDFAGPRLTRSVAGPAEPAARFELREDLPRLRDAVATIERRQAKLRDRIAVEEVERTAEPGKAGGRTVTIGRLNRRASSLVGEQADARLALGEAEERARWEQASAASSRESVEMLGRGIASLVALALLSALVVLLRLLTELPIMLVWVVSGSALALAALLAADGLGLIAALALGAVVIILVVAQGAPHEQLRARRAAT